MIITMASIALMSVQDERWQVAAETNNFVETVDMQTLHRSGTTVTLWQRRTFNEVQPDGASVTLGRTRYDCESRSYIVLQIIRRRADGSVIVTVNPAPHEQQPQPVSPESVGEGVINVVCR